MGMGGFFDMKRFYWLIVLILSQSLGLLGQEKGVDTIIFKADPALPAAFSGKEVKCLVLEESTEEVKADFSMFPRIADIREFPKSAIEKLLIADRSPYEIKKIESRILRPDSTMDAAYYEEILGKVIKPFLEKYPGTKASQKVADAAVVLRQDKFMVEHGWGRKGEQWFAPEEMEVFREETKLEQLMDEIQNVQQQVNKGEYSVLAGLTGKVEVFKDNLYYPYLIKGLQSAIQPAGSAVPLDLQKLSRSPIQSLLDASNRFEEARQMVLRNQEQQIKDPEALVDPMEEFVQVARVWPQLKQMKHFFQKNLRYFLDLYWMASLQEKQGSRASTFAKLSSCWDQINGTDVLQVEIRLAIQKEIELAKSFHDKLEELQKTRNYADLSTFQLPGGLIYSDEFKKEFTKTGLSALAEMKASNGMLENGRQAYAAGNLEETKKQLQESVKHWPGNPALPVFRDEMLENVRGLIAKRKRDQATNLLNVMTTIWPGDSKVYSAEQSLEYSRSFLTMVDNFTYGMIFFIGFCVIGIVLGIRFCLKMFTD